MEQEQKQKNWIIRTNDFKTSPFNHKLNETDQSQRVYKAITTLFKFWGIGICCIIIPVFHFILVPACLFSGVYYFFKSLKYNFQIEEECAIVCPSCQSTVGLKKIWFESDYRFHCKQCQSQLVLERE